MKRFFSFLVLLSFSFSFLVISAYAITPYTYRGTCESCGKGTYQLKAPNYFCTDFSRSQVCSICSTTTIFRFKGLGHDYGIPKTIPATCTSKGQIILTCSYCSDTGVEYIPQLAHSFTVYREAPSTCTEGGSHWLECSMCGLAGDKTPVAALGHLYKDAVLQEASCVDPGLVRHVCERPGCGDVYDTTVPALGHALSTSVTDATCTLDGSKVTTCSRCDYSAAETIPQLGHVWEETSRTEPTYLADGSIVSTCTRCQETKTEVIPKLDPSGCPHNWAEISCVEPTYIATGLVTYQCSMCRVTREEILPKLDPGTCVHQWVEVDRVEPTYEADGSIIYRCSVCDETKVVRIPMLTEPDPDNPSIVTDLKLAFQSVFGTYVPIMTPKVTTTSSGTEVNQVITSGVASGAAGVDYEYLAGIFLFAILLYCILRLLGGVLK